MQKGLPKVAFIYIRVERGRARIHIILRCGTCAVYKYFQCAGGGIGKKLHIFEFHPRTLGKKFPDKFDRYFRHSALYIYALCELHALCIFGRNSKNLYFSYKYKKMLIIFFLIKEKKARTQECEIYTIYPRAINGAQE